MTKERLRQKIFSTGELAAQYGICLKTFKRLLIPHRETIGERVGRYFNIRQVQTIYNCLGNPLILNQETETKSS